MKRRERHPHNTSEFRLENPRIERHPLWTGQRTKGLHPPYSDLRVRLLAMLRTVRLALEPGDHFLRGLNA